MSPGIPAFADISGRGCSGSDLEAARSSEQPGQSLRRFAPRRWRSSASAIGISARPWWPRSWASCTGSFSGTIWRATDELVEQHPHRRRGLLHGRRFKAVAEPFDIRADGGRSSLSVPRLAGFLTDPEANILLKRNQTSLGVQCSPHAVRLPALFSALATSCGFRMPPFVKVLTTGLNSARS